MRQLADFSLMGAMLLLLAAPISAFAAGDDAACWRRPELKAYDITMQTLMLAHVAAACDEKTYQDRGEDSPASLKERLQSFLAAHEGEMSRDRAPLSDYYRRAYGDDWQEPFQKSLAREDQRVADRISKTSSPQFCTGAGGALGAIATGSWQNFETAATSAGWHDKAGFPECP